MDKSGTLVIVLISFWDTFFHLLYLSAQFLCENSWSQKFQDLHRKLQG